MRARGAAGHQNKMVTVQDKAGALGRGVGASAALPTDREEEIDDAKCPHWQMGPETTVQGSSLRVRGSPPNPASLMPAFSAHLSPGLRKVGVRRRERSRGRGR